MTNQRLKLINENLRKNYQKKYRKTLLAFKPFMAMTDFELIEFYLKYDHSYSNLHRIAIMENEMFDRDMQNIIKLSKKHNLNDLEAIKISLENRMIISYKEINMTYLKWILRGFGRSLNKQEDRIKLNKILNDLKDFLGFEEVKIDDWEYYSYTLHIYTEFINNKYFSKITSGDNLYRKITGNDFIIYFSFEADKSINLDKKLIDFLKSELR